MLSVGGSSCFSHRKALRADVTVCSSFRVWILHGLLCSCLTEMQSLHICWRFSAKDQDRQTPATAGGAGQQNPPHSPIGPAVLQNNLTSGWLSEGAIPAKTLEGNGHLLPECPALAPTRARQKGDVRLGAGEPAPTWSNTGWWSCRSSCSTRHCSRGRTGHCPATSSGWARSTCRPPGADGDPQLAGSLML